MAGEGMGGDDRGGDGGMTGGGDGGREGVIFYLLLISRER